MKSYVYRQLWTEAVPFRDEVQWVSRCVLRIGTATPEQIYGAESLLRPTGQEVYDRWNGLRADVVSHYVDPPETTELCLIPLHPPKGDHPAPWLLEHVLGYNGREIEVFSNHPELSVGRQPLPLFVENVRQMRQLYRSFPANSLLRNYHRARYQLLFDVLDGYYHEDLRSFP